MIRALFVSALALLALPAVAQEQWEFVKNDRDVDVYRKEVAGSDIVAFKGVTTANIPIGKLLAVFNTPEERQYWVDRYAEHTTLEKAKYRETYWIHFKLPFVVSDRDYVLQAIGTPDEATRTFKVRIKSVEHPKIAAELDCCVRATVLGTYYEFVALPDGKTKITVEVHTDPKGAIPNWLVNLIQKSWPSKTLGGLVDHTRVSKRPPLPEFAHWHDKELPKPEPVPEVTPTPGAEVAPAPDAPAIEAAPATP